MLSSTLASIGLLAIGWQIGANVALSVSTKTSEPATSVAPVAAPIATAMTGPADGAYLGDSVRTQFGNVQVQVIVAGGAITDVGAVHLTDHDGRSVQISNRAAPILRSEVLASQSAHVSSVSGATYTSMAYLTSLQSALDQAGA